MKKSQSKNKKKTAASEPKKSSNIGCFFLLVLLFALGGGAIYYVVYQNQPKEPEKKENLLDIFKKIGKTTKETSKVVIDKTKTVIDSAKKQIEPFRPAKESISEEPPSKYTGMSLYAGEPIITHYPNAITILENPGFKLAYDEKRKNPAWAAYRVSRYDLEIPTEEIHSYRPDPRTQSKVEAKDFAHTGYEMAQLVPSDIMSMRFGSAAESNCFLMSNITPQLSNLNAGPWQNLIGKIKMPYPNNLNEIWVVTGPIYDNWSNRLSFGIEVPSSFFVIIIDEIQGKSQALAFILPQNINQGESLQSFLTTIDEVESQSGFNFFAQLDDDLEEELEKSSRKSIW